MINVADHPALQALRRDIEEIFGARLHALVLYGPEAVGEAAPQSTGSASTTTRDTAVLHTLALVDRVHFADLTACARKSRGWTGRRLAAPLILGSDEFIRSLDTFPLEYGDIIANHVVIAGTNPFEGVAVRPEDLRRACEVQAKSHLIHLREGYLEAAGEPTAVARLITASAGSFRSLLANVARLQGESVSSPTELARRTQAGLELNGVVVERVISLGRPRDLGGPEALTLYPGYLDAVERLWRFVDGWGIEPRRA